MTPPLNSGQAYTAWLLNTPPVHLNKHIRVRKRPGLNSWFSPQICSSQWQIQTHRCWSQQPYKDPCLPPQQATSNYWQALLAESSVQTHNLTAFPSLLLTVVQATVIFFLDYCSNLLIGLLTLPMLPVVKPPSSSQSDPYRTVNYIISFFWSKASSGLPSYQKKSKSMIWPCSPPTLLWLADNPYGSQINFKSVSLGG